MSIGKRSKNNVEKIRKKIYARDGFKCVASVWGSPCRGRLTVQHAVKRGMGGSAIFDAPRFLRTMCWHHNDLDASDVMFRRLSLLNGWSMTRPEALQSETPVPVLYPDGRWYVLDDEFEREPLEESTAAIYRAHRLEYVTAKVNALQNKKTR